MFPQNDIFGVSINAAEQAQWPVVANVRREITVRVVDANQHDKVLKQFIIKEARWLTPTRILSSKTNFGHRLKVVGCWDVSVCFFAMEHLLSYGFKRLLLTVSTLALKNSCCSLWKNRNQTMSLSRKCDNDWSHQSFKCIRKKKLVPWLTVWIGCGSKHLHQSSSKCCCWSTAKERMEMFFN